MGRLKVTIEYEVFSIVFLHVISDDCTLIEIKQPWEVICLLCLIQALVIALRMLQRCGTSIPFKVDICLIQISQDRSSVSNCRGVALIHLLIDVGHAWINNLDPH